MTPSSRAPAFPPNRFGGFRMIDLIILVPDATHLGLERGCKDVDFGSSEGSRDWI